MRNPKRLRPPKQTADFQTKPKLSYARGQLTPRKRRITLTKHLDLRHLIRRGGRHRLRHPSARLRQPLGRAHRRSRPAPLQTLLEIELDYPVNAMTRICKKLSLPKKEALEAIAMFEMAYGGGSATAHDVFMALQGIPYLMKIHKMPEAKMLVVAEHMARALTLKWNEYDLAKAVNY